MTTHRPDVATTHVPAARAPGAARRPWPSHEWCRYFRRNATMLLDVPWESGAGVTLAERDAIADSVREFQLGESAEGRHFVRAAKAYAARSGDGAYVEAVRLLIGEEQRHARDLARFLRLAGVPLAKTTWADSAFRWLRKRAGVEVCVSVLVTAEIIAKVYYAALGEATGSPVLRRICEQILRDEVEHVRFQAERLAILRAGRPRLVVAGLHLAHRAMFALACLVVWRKHARALRAGGYRFGRFWRCASSEMRQAVAQMAPICPAASKVFCRSVPSVRP
jgi:hypothetical protein